MILSSQLSVISTVYIHFALLPMSPANIIMSPRGGVSNSTISTFGISPVSHGVFIRKVVMALMQNINERLECLCFTGPGEFLTFTLLLLSAGYLWKQIGIFYRSKPHSRVFRVNDITVLDWNLRVCSIPALEQTLACLEESTGGVVHISMGKCRKMLVLRLAVAKITYLDKPLSTESQECYTRVTSSFHIMWETWTMVLCPGFDKQVVSRRDSEGFPR